MNRALLWKDLRQLSPLVAMLFVVVVLLWLARTLVGTYETRIPSVWIPLAMPSLLAAGAGAILVGNEKETRTLRWMVSLPVPFQQVFQSKLAAGVIGLFATWVGAFVLLALMGSTYWEADRGLMAAGSTLQFSLSFWILHTFFLLFAGLYTAWRIENAFGSLIAMLPIASIPFVVSSVGSKMYYLKTKQYISPEQAVTVATWLTVPAIAITVWLGYRAAARFFEAAAAPSSNVSTQSAASAADLDAWRPPAAAMPARKPFRFSFSSLVWQSIHHNAWALAGLGAAMIAGVISLALITTQSGAQFLGGTLVPVSVLGFLGVSWLGVFAFAGDGSSSRLKFMADRGISPTLVWWTRHAAALSLIAAALLVYHATCRLVMVDGYQRHGPMLSLLALTLTAILVYGVSQWISQLIRVLGGTAFLAPLLSGLAVVWLPAAISITGVSPWVAMVCLVIPLLATWSSMRWHMDGRRGFGFWTINAGLLVLMFALPVANVAWDIFRFPSMDGDRARYVLESASKLDWPPKYPRSLSLTYFENDDLDDFTSDGMRSGQEVADMLATMEGVPADFLNLDPDASRPLRAETGTLQANRGTAEFYRLKAIAGTGEWSQFAVWSDFLIETARRYRLSYRIEDQCGADAIEIYLTQTYAKPEMREQWDEGFAKRAIQFIGDPSSRNAARRQAVLASYRFFIENRFEVNDNGKRIYKGNSLGGYELDEFFGYVPWGQRDWIQLRGAGAIIDELLRMIDAGEAGEPTLAIRQRMHRLMFGPNAPFQTGPYADRLRVSSSSRDLMYDHFTVAFPGSQWYAPWETDAAQMLTELESEVAP